MNNFLFKKKEFYAPTLAGWSVILIICGILFYLFLVNCYSFLAPCQPQTQADILIVEGWIPDYALKEAYNHFRKGTYRSVLVTGGPVEYGSFLTPHKTYAQIGESVLEQFGLPDSVVIAVPSELTQRDRTFTSALAVKLFLSENNIQFANLNLLSLGVHSRRSWYLFKKALHPHKIGIISITDQTFNPQKWWTSSQGVRSVLDESIAYIYGRFFTPDK